MPLTPAHLADLRRSDLSDNQIRACGFRTETDPKAVATLLGWTSPAKTLGPCLLIPFFGAAGEPLDYTRAKPNRPQAAKGDGKPIKYESPRKKANGAYFPPGTRAALADAMVPLLVTEGEKKAAMADQEGFSLSVRTSRNRASEKKAAMADQEGFPASGWSACTGSKRRE